MYPDLTITTVEKTTTLKDHVATLGEDILYAFDRKVVGVRVNNRRLWSSAKLKPGARTPHNRWWLSYNA
jgi:hypothetical protein